MLHSLPCKPCLYSGNRTYKHYHMKLCRMTPERKSTSQTFTTLNCIEYTVTVEWESSSKSVNTLNCIEYTMSLERVLRSQTLQLKVALSTPLLSSGNRPHKLYHMKLYRVHHDCLAGIVLTNCTTKLYRLHNDSRAGIELTNFTT